MNEDMPTQAELLRDLLAMREEGRLVAYLKPGGKELMWAFPSLERRPDEQYLTREEILAFYQREGLVPAEGA